MKLKFNWVFTLCLVFFIQFSFAQEKTITGTVTSKQDGLSIPGVNVLVQGTSRGTQTDFDGKFTIQASVGEKLVFSLLGSKTQTVVVGTSNVIDVSLSEDEAVLLKTVSVEGYNITRTKATSNVASTTIGGKTINSRPNASFAQTLQGQIAGVNVSTGSGQPGSSSNIIIRGYGSLTGKAEPLFVIDGVPLNSDNFRSLNPDEIESATALVDAGATSKYGNRGANGVIIVTTKRASYESPLKFKYVATTGFSKMQDAGYEKMNSQELLTLEREKGVGPGSDGFVAGGEPMTDAQIAAYSTTDWNEYFFRTGISTAHDLSFTSGSKNLRSFTSFGYRSEEGILENSDLRRFNFRNNLDGKSADGKFNYSISSSLNYSKSNTVLGQDLAAGNIYYDPMVSANRGVPYLSPSAYPGSKGLVDLVTSYPTNVFIPYQSMDIQANNVNENDNVKSVENFAASYQFDENWKVFGSAGLDYSQVNTSMWISPNAYVSLFQEYLSNNTVKFGVQQQNFARVAAIDLNANVNYNKKFGKSTVDATAFYEYYYANSLSFGYSKQGLNSKTSAPATSQGFITTTSSDTYIPSVSASNPTASLLSYFAVVDYDYDGKYGVGGTIRRDGSSRFNESNAWGTFYSFTGRWNIARENFMEGSVFQMLKLRASYGTTGNQDILGSTFSGLNLTRELYTSSTGYNNTTSYVVRQLANPDLKWETVTQSDIGLDFGVFNNRFTGRFDVYDKKTTDLYQPVGISAVNGTSSISANYGALENKGIEAQLAYQIVHSDSGFNLSLNFNGAYNKTIMVDVPNVGGFQDNGLTVRSEGHRVDEFYMVRYIGVNPANGNLLFLDKDGNATETPANDGSDRVYTGKVSDPQYAGGFGFDADYKGFYMTGSWSYALDFYRIDYDLDDLQNPNNIGQFNMAKSMLNAWTPDNRVTDIPSINATNLSASDDSDRYLVDASYVRLRYFTFGYDVPKHFLDKTPFDQVKAYIQGENLVTWSKWQGRDAENRTNTAATYAQYPTPKIVSLGFQLAF